MIKRDYFPKLIEQLDKTLTQVDDKKDEDDIEGALEIIKASYTKLLEINIPDLESERLVSEKTLGFGELSVLAELLKEEGDLYYELEDEHFLTRYRQSIAVFNELNEKERVYSFDREAKIEMMQARLKAYDES